MWDRFPNVPCEALDALTHSDAGLKNLCDISAMLRLQIKPA